MAAQAKRGSEETHYATLCVPRSASPKTIRLAYLRLAKVHHPDAASSFLGDAAAAAARGRRTAAAAAAEREEEAAAVRFCRIQRAYEVLRDPQQRATYDATLPPPSPVAYPSSSSRRAAAGAAAAGNEEEEDFARLFREQVARMRLEKERAWREMQMQRARGAHQFGLANLFFLRRSRGSSSEGTAAEAAGEAAAAGRGVAAAAAGRRAPPQLLSHALLRAMPLLLLPCLLFYGCYKHARIRREESRAAAFVPTLAHDELGRAFMIDSKGRRCRVAEFDFPESHASGRGRSR